MGLKSGSIYKNDLGGDPALEAYVGHVENLGGVSNYDNPIQLVKTHERNPDGGKAIYVIRDARPVALSLYNFYQKKISLENIILGNHRWGTWSDHVKAWEHIPPSDNLTITYDDLVDNLDSSLETISEFLNVRIITNKIPTRASMSDGKWINKKSIPWQDALNQEQIDLCQKVNGEYLKKYGCFMKV